MAESHPAPVPVGPGEPPVPRAPRRVAPRRRAAGESSRDTREAILSAIERLLENRRLDELTVVDLIQSAGVSRATFYMYFESKHAAVTAIGEGVMEQIHDLWSPWLDGAEPADKPTLDRLWIQSIELWRAHQPLLMAAAEAARADAAVAGAWATLMQRYSLTVRRHIEQARASGAAPAGPDPDLMATLLVWLNESALYLAFGTNAPPPDDCTLADALAAIWLRTIYDGCREPPHRVAIPESSPPSSAPIRGRGHGARLRRTGNTEVRQAILAATEQLLEERPLEELTAVDVVEAAGFSRPTFYMYFESKHAAVAALADEVLADIYERLWRPAFEDSNTSSPAGTVEHFVESIAGWHEHRAVLVAAAKGWRADPTVYRQWGERMHGIALATAAYIRHARAAGAVAPEPDADTLATLLVWHIETMLYLSLSGLSPHLTDQRRLAAALSSMWLRAIHGSTR